MDLSERSGFVYRHPWELSRTRVILKELKNLSIHGKVLDIGCGDAYFDKRLLKMFPSVTELWGVDIYMTERGGVSKDGRAHYVNSYEEIAGKKFDFILLMDVLEHIEDDVMFMRRLDLYLSMDSVLLITVPAFQWLFSLHDKELKHFRRYDFKTLKYTLKKAGYSVRSHSYFYLSLILMRILSRNRTQNLCMWNLPEQNLLTKIIEVCLNIDYFMLRKLSNIGIYIGGLSLLVVCQKDQA